MRSKRIDSLLKADRNTVRRMDRNTAHFARTPRAVLFDKRLTCYDKTVYDALSWQCWQGRTAAVGSRTIAGKLNISRSQVKESLKALIITGHIESAGRLRNRNVYILTSPVFGQKQGHQTIIRSGPSGQQRVSVAAEDVA